MALRMKPSPHLPKIIHGLRATLGVSGNPIFCDVCESTCGAFEKGETEKLNEIDRIWGCSPFPEMTASSQARSYKNQTESSSLEDVRCNKHLDSNESNLKLPVFFLCDDDNVG